jgi:hypothetical protein
MKKTSKNGLIEQKLRDGRIFLFESIFTFVPDVSAGISFLLEHPPDVSVRTFLPGRPHSAGCLPAVNASNNAGIIS